MFHILVADDDRNTRRYMQAVLEDAHYTVTTARDGAEALDILGREHIDLIVLDVMMAEMDGYELTRELREAQDNIPILMVSARQEGREEKEREMCQGLKEMIDEARQEGREEKEKEKEEEMCRRIHSLMKKAGWSLEQTMEMMDIPEEGRETLRRQMAISM